jgi:hypothetical protein
MLRTYALSVCPKITFIMNIPILMKLKFLLFAVLCLMSSTFLQGQSVYTEDFGSSTTVALPYVYGTNATGSASKNANLSNPSWTQSNASAGFGGVTGGSLSATAPSTDVMTCTFTVPAGLDLTPTSITYNYRISPTGPTKMDVSIAGTTGSTASIAQVTTVRSGAFFVTAVTSNFTTSTSLTGNITLTVNFSGSGGGTVRLDNVTLNGSVNSASTVDYANIKTPGTGTINLGSVFNVTAQVGKTGLTTGAGQAAGITGWIGYSSANTDPSGAGWTWIDADYSADSGTFDEYVLDLGSQITTPGTYYYASRFQLDAALTYKYGGIKNDMSPGGIWDNVTYISGVLTVNPTPVQEITVKGVVGSNPTISSGDITPSGTNNTLFASQPIGVPQAKNFRIQNVGTAALSVPTVTVVGGNTADFAVTAAPPYTIAPGTFVDFTITFTPTAIGSRTTTVTIANNDSNENPYTFLIEGTGTCATATNTITPLSGPVGTTVTVTASANNLTGATVTFNGVAATVTQVSSTQIKVVVPAGATSGTLLTTNAAGCQASNAFTVIDNAATTCQGSNIVSDLFISEVTDASYGGLSYIEIYNGTSGPVPLANYALQFFSNGNTTAFATVNLSGTIAVGATFVVSTSLSGSDCGANGGDGSYAATPGLGLQTTVSGVNFMSGSNNNIGHDHIALFKSGVKIDSWGVSGSDTWAISLNLQGRGADFRRKNNVAVPKVAYTNADWDIIDWIGSGLSSCPTNDYSNIGTFNFAAGTPPTVTTQPSYTPSCNSTSFTVSGTEGFAGSNPLAYQWYVAAPGATSWTAVTNTGVYTGATTVTLNVSDVTGLDGYQYYCQIMENTATCYKASNAVMITESQAVTWNGTAWVPSPFLPTITSKVTIDGSYDTSINGDFQACSVTVKANATLIIKDSDYVTIQNNLTVDATGVLQITNEGSLVMISDAGTVTNNGTTEVHKTTTPYKKYDYTYWSSPVATGQINAATFPGWRLDYAFQFATASYADVLNPVNGFDDNGDAWAAASGAMTKGKGYAIMAPTTGAFPATSSVTFSGAVNNGQIFIPIVLSGNAANPSDDFNLLGNPYPSAIYADEFIYLNSVTNVRISGTLYFWTHNTEISTIAPGPDTYNFITDDYAMYNLSGAVGTGTGEPSDSGSLTPSGYIASTQGFFVEAISPSTVEFNNSMRKNTYANDNFFRQTAQTNDAVSTVNDRIWLNLENPNGLFSQQLIAYSDNTTLDYDRAYDGMVNQTSNSVSFYSFIGDDKYRIQARPTFSEEDFVPLGFSSAVAGTFTIGIEHKQGQLDRMDTNIYLEDKVLSIIHDLKEAPYSFTTETGTFNNRFTLRYTNSVLGGGEFEHPENMVAVAASDAQISVKSYNEPIKAIAVYDILGRQVFNKVNVDAHEFAIQNLTERQALIVKVTLKNGAVVNKKIVF